MHHLHSEIEGGVVLVSNKEDITIFVNVSDNIMTANVHIRHDVVTP